MAAQLPPISLQRARLLSSLLAFSVMLFLSASSNLLGQDEKELLQQGTAACKSGDYDTGIADLTQVVQLDPNNAGVYLVRAFAYSKKKEYDKEISDLNQAILVAPNDVSAFAGGSPSSAEVKRINIQTINVAAYEGLGAAYADKKDYDKAIEAFNHVIQLDPKREIAYGGLGDIYNQKGDYDKAIEEFNQAIQLAPQDALVYDYRAYAYLNKGDNDKAIADLNQAIQIDPKSAKGYIARGYYYSKTGSKEGFEKSVADYNQAVRLMPENVTIQTELGATYEKLAHVCAQGGDFDDAVKWEGIYLATPNLGANDIASAQSQLALYQAHKFSQTDIPKGTEQPTSPSTVVTVPTTPSSSSVISDSVPESTNSPATVVKPWSPPDVIPTQTNWTWTTLDGKVYQNVVVTKLEADSVSITHSLGAAHIPVSQLPPDIKKALDYP